MIVVISAPSGTGKTTVVDKLLKKDRNLRRVITHTTRSPRPGEKNKQDYHFVAQDKFKYMLKNKYFVEWAKVYGCYYGTSKAELFKNTKDAVLVIEAKGAKQIKRIYPTNAVFIMLLPPSKKELIKRIKKRASSKKENISMRIKNAKHEVRQMLWYDYVVLNDHLDVAVVKLANIIKAQRNHINVVRKSVMSFL